jgi:hypothetical protein
MRHYSHYFSCIYDEAAPVGSLGRGTHYSVFRAAEWFNVVRQPLSKAEKHDFAVIWDEDHDTRIIEAIERIYMAGLLAPVQFIGERKGFLTVIVAAKYRFFDADESAFLEYTRQIQDLVDDVLGDYWTVEVGIFDRALVDGMSHQTEIGGIIADRDDHVLTYLRNIDNLWSLGTKPYEPSPTPEPLTLLPI